MEVVKSSETMQRSASARVTVVRPTDRTRETVQTSGMTREQAVSTDNLWAGYVQTAAGMASGWHHHGEYDTTVYVLTGAARFESGTGGQEIVEAHPGDFVFIPKGTVHRESNPTEKPSDLVVIRVGSGAPVVNVDSPLAGQ